jgi:hypothetical protein
VVAARGTRTAVKAKDKTMTDESNKPEAAQDQAGSDSKRLVMRYEAALKEIRFSGNAGDARAIWMQKVAAHAMEPEKWPHHDHPMPGKLARDTLKDIGKNVGKTVGAAFTDCCE